METITPICPGCGAPLQSKSPHTLGYRQKDDQVMCQRCFRLKHYGDTERFDQSSVGLTQVLREVRAIEGTLAVLMDLVNYDQKMLDVLESSLFDRSILLIFTKRDLLPITLSQHKIAQMVRRSLQGRKLRIQDALTVSVFDRDAMRELTELLRSLDGNIIIAGMVNAGKSSLINALTGRDQLTVSPHAHTTLAIQALPFYDKIIYDTPGFHAVNALEGLSAKQAAPYAITKPVKPLTYQIHQEQTFVLGDVAAVKVVPIGTASLTVYVSANVPVHRSGHNAPTYLLNHHPLLAQLTSHVIAKNVDEASDVVITGLGWLSLKGQFASLEILTSHPECCSLRKALL